VRGFNGQRIDLRDVQVIALEKGMIPYIPADMDQDQIAASDLTDLCIAATLAGIGLLGSSLGSLEEITGKIQTSEARRDGMIDGMSLPTVQDS
jgi:hypothetical protein